LYNNFVENAVAAYKKQFPEAKDKVKVYDVVIKDGARKL